MNRRDLLKKCALAPFVFLLPKAERPAVLPEEGVPKRRTGIKYSPAGSSDKVIRNMVAFKGRIYLACEDGVYLFEDDKFRKLELIEGKLGKWNT
jgi:hypothetical protein